jgi:type III secretory pathway lipoprotein EscJ
MLAVLNTGELNGARSLAIKKDDKLRRALGLETEPEQMDEAVALLNKQGYVAIRSGLLRTNIVVIAKESDRRRAQQNVPWGMPIYIIDDLCYLRNLIDWGRVIRLCDRAGKARS